MKYDDALIIKFLEYARDHSLSDRFNWRHFGFSCHNDDKDGVIFDVFQDAKREGWIDPGSEYCNDGPGIIGITYKGRQHLKALKAELAKTPLQKTGEIKTDTVKGQVIVQVSAGIIGVIGFLIWSLAMFLIGWWFSK